VKAFTFREYCTFVLFFPQLIAGPIVHYREMMPQFAAANCRFDKENFAVGPHAGIFWLVQEDSPSRQCCAPDLTNLPAVRDRRAHPFLLAWAAGVGFTLQVYFDFSGYTDMALGLGRFFGIKLPPNFNSPLKASSIVDFWLNWHMTLTRFLTAYIYNPLVLSLTRQRLANGRPGFRRAQPVRGGVLVATCGAAVTTMFISGLWHGAGYGFIIFGLMHGVYLVINHGWRVYAAHRWRDKAVYVRWMRPVGFVLTLVAVVAAMLFFRAPTVASAVDLLRGTMGLNGIAAPHGLTAAAAAYGTDLKEAATWIAILLFIALVCPNTLEILAPYEPALGVRPKPTAPALAGIRIPAWGPSLPWAVAISIVAAVATFSVGGPSEFLYWQFWNTARVRTESHTELARSAAGEQRSGVRTTLVSRGNIVAVHAKNDDFAG
jgi:D-alanyl-lipoteichoic acid acyltransferase DltB (MBOAT superfamily)